MARRKSKRSVHSIAETSAAAWVDTRLAVLRGNLRRGASFRAKRTGAQVTMAELTAAIKKVVRGVDVPSSSYTISYKERGFTGMTAETEAAWLRALRLATRSETAKERRKLAARTKRRKRRAA